MDVPIASEVFGLAVGEKMKFEKAGCSEFGNMENSAQRLSSHRADLRCVNSKSEYPRSTTHPTEHGQSHRLSCSLNAGRK